MKKMQQTIYKNKEVSHAECIGMDVILIRFMVIFSIFSSLILGAQLNQKSLKHVVLKSASEFDYPPFSIVTQDGKADGFSVELLRSSIEVMGGSVKFDVDKWDTIKQKLKNGEIDVLPLVGKTDERTKDYDFTAHYFRLSGAVFIRSDDTRIKNYEDLKDKVIVVMKGDNAEEYVRRKKIGKEIVTFDSYEVAFRALSSGKYDAVVAQELVGVNLVYHLELKNIKLVENILEDYKQDFCFAVKKGDAELLALLNEGLSTVIANGTYDKLYIKWFHNAVDNSFIHSTLFKILLLLLGLLLLGLLFSYIWVRALNKKVNQKTMELKELNQTLESRIENALIDLKETEDMMIAQSRQAAMGEMISMIAHQWRQPISVISMGANNILADIELDMLDTETLRGGMLGIVRQTQELSSIIDDFRNFFKPSKEITEVLVEDVLKEAYKVIDASFKNNDVTVTSEMKSVLKIKTYSQELMQVILNILKNAKEALVDNKVTDKHVHIFVEDGLDNIVIKICDNAKGIQEEIMGRIFEPYFSTKYEKNGTGLGLYMSKTIIEKHLKGSIKAYNKDEGVCFEIALPYGLQESIQ